MVSRPFKPQTTASKAWGESRTQKTFLRELSFPVFIVLLSWAIFLPIHVCTQTCEELEQRAGELGLKRAPALKCKQIPLDSEVPSLQ